MPYGIHQITAFGMSRPGLTVWPLIFSDDICSALRRLTRNWSARAHLKADDVDDAVFLADFVAWKHSNRDNPDGMPEWLRLARRERWMSGKGRPDDSG